MGTKAADMILDERISLLATWLSEARYPVFFTGAGISTESGLPDYRGPDGIWTRRDKGLPPKGHERPWDSFQPSRSHRALVELQDLGKMKFLISQNVDNLHIKSGIRHDLIAELHGNMAKLRCTRCGATVDKSSGASRCSCGGSFVSSVVDFGMPLPEKDLMLSIEHSRKSDLFVVLGSSLVVVPAAQIPGESLQAGARLVIINQGETPYDRHAHLRFFERVGDVLPEAVKRLKLMLQ
ncbi:MAG: Sir2 family NAD-dependent protein deacetylase [Desulfomonilia bacterium]